MKQYTSRILQLIAAAGAIVGSNAQTAAPTVLTIEGNNAVEYLADISDASKLASSTVPVPPSSARTFTPYVFLGDLMALNGRPVKGTVEIHGQFINLTPNSAPGQAIADAGRQLIAAGVFELLQPDGTPLGSITFSGFGGAGAPPPGSPTSAIAGAAAITGGTGSFLGVRGQMSLASITKPPRVTSMMEDPSARRSNGGGAGAFVLEIIPSFVPTVLQVQGGPAIVHASDNTLVSAAHPARAGEVLTLYAANLGPIRAAMDPGQPFPSGALNPVIAPVDVVVNGLAAEVLYAGGVPGTANNYQVNFRMPDGVSSGAGSLRVVAAYIIGDSVMVPVQ